jgi:uncharacterized membrane protein YccF (DUF307 family)
MSFLGNLIWLIFGGFVAGIGYIIGGLLLCVTIIGIPFGTKAIRFGTSIMLPFGKDIEKQSGGDGPFAMVFNVVWLVFFGWEIAIAHLISGLILTITIIGIPFGRKHFQLIPVSLFPFTYTLDKIR